MSSMDEVVTEFLVESLEGLDQLDQDLVALEENPDASDIIARIFRILHTIKGSSGFLGYERLGKITHAGESLLSRMRDGELRSNPAITTALLATVDGVRYMLGEVESGGNDGNKDYAELIATLKALTAGDAELPLPPNVAVAVEAVVASPPVAEALPVTASPIAEVVSLAAAPSVESAVSTDNQGASIAENVRVDVALLDSLVDLAGELVLTRNHILQLAKDREDPVLATATQRLNFVTAQLQEGVMRMRMQPVSTLLTKFPRMVRDLARSCRKLVRLEVDGGNTELDKSLIEAIKGPLTHLLRNCVDHGVEGPELRAARNKHPEGLIRIRSFHQNGMVHIEVSDDGGGLPLAKIRDKAVARGLVSAESAASLSDGDAAALIFLPGFSTAEQVTSVSGRGVGMDVVKTNVEQIGGTVVVDTREGHGTAFTLKIPLTLAIVPALVVRSQDCRYAIAQVSVVEMLRLQAGSARGGIEWMHGTPVYRLRGNLLPVLFLEQALGGHVSRESFEASMSPGEDEYAPSKYLVVLSVATRTFGLVVDAVLDQQEIVVKPMPKLLSGLDAYAGATLLGDGRVALILDALGIAQRAHIVSELREEASAARTQVQAANTNGRHTLLLMRGPDDARLAIALDEVARLETFDVAKVEAGGEHDVVQYCGAIMPLLSPSVFLPPRRSRLSHVQVVPTPPSRMLSVVVLGTAEGPIGLVIDDVLDVVETSDGLDPRGRRQGVKGTLIIDNRVTEVLDLDWIAASQGLATRGADGVVLQVLSAVGA